MGGLTDARSSGDGAIHTTPSIPATSPGQLAVTIAAMLGKTPTHVAPPASPSLPVSRAVPASPSPTSVRVTALPATPNVLLDTTAPLAPPAPLSTATLPPALADTVDALHQIAAAANQSGDQAAQQVGSFVGNLANQITSTANQIAGVDLVAGVVPTGQTTVTAILKSPVTWVIGAGLLALLIRRHR